MTDTYGEPLPGRYRGPSSHPIPSGSTQGEEPQTDSEARMSIQFLCRRGRKGGCETIYTPEAVEAIAREQFGRLSAAHEAEHGHFPEDGIGLMADCLDAAADEYAQLWDDALAIDGEWTEVKRRRDIMRHSLDVPQTDSEAEAPEFPLDDQRQNTPDALREG